MKVEIDQRYLMLIGPSCAVQEVRVIEFSPSRKYVRVEYAGKNLCWEWVVAHEQNFVERLEDPPECQHTLNGKHWLIRQEDGSMRCQSCGHTPEGKEVES